MKLIYPLNIKNDFVFNSSPRDFTVTEIPLYEFSGEGEHLILQVRKKDMTTWEMLDAISNHIGVRRRDIGYAGLKDKNAMTIQYISLLAKFEEKLKDFNHDKIKIVSTTRHNNKIRVGHLKGNHFKIRLKKVLGVQKDKLQSGLKWIKNNGVPNYFGNQRFGNNGDNWIDGKKLLNGELKIRDKKTREFLVGSYQSYLFNNWLSKRMEINHLVGKFTTNEIENILNMPTNSLDGIEKQKHFFKLLQGDVMMHYPYGRVFIAEDLESEANRFDTKDISVSGLLAGKKATLATQSAKLIEDSFNEDVALNGTRRYAWIFVEDIKSKYVEEKAHFELSFTLPKGSYATNVLDILRGDNTQ
jgi:tRNA pseudouridine13 synthase